MNRNDSYQLEYEKRFARGQNEIHVETEERRRVLAAHDSPSTIPFGW